MSKKLLLADDSIAIQKVIELVLSDKDFEITSVDNGKDALSKTEEFTPDIVLADIEMPMMNGYELCKQIKTAESTRNIPVLLLAGAFEPIDENKVSEVSADDYIIKPFESQELLEKIDLLLSAPLTEEPVEEMLEETTKEEEEKTGFKLAGMTEEPEIEALEEQLKEEVEEELAIEGKVDEKDELGEEDIKERAEEEKISLEDVAEDMKRLLEESKGRDEEIPRDVIEEEKVPDDLSETFQESADVSATEEVAPYKSPELEMPGKDEILSMLQVDIDKKVSDLIGSISKEEMSSIFKDTIKESIADNMKINSELINESINKEIHSKIDEAIKPVDLKDSINQTLSSEIKGFIENMTDEIIKVAREITEQNIKNIFEEKIPSLKTEVENKISEVLHDIADRLIKKEIENIKEEFE